MFEMTYGELFLFVWAVAASGAAWMWRSEAHERSRMLRRASKFIKHLVQDDGLRDQLRRIIDAKGDTTDIQFGSMGE